MRTWLFFALAIGGPAFTADCAPEKLVRMVTQNMSPGIPSDSFATKPKITYRLGNLGGKNVDLVSVWLAPDSPLPPN